MKKLQFFFSQILGNPSIWFEAKKNCRTNQVEFAVKHAGGFVNNCCRLAPPAASHSSSCSLADEYSAISMRASRPSWKNLLMVDWRIEWHFYCEEKGKAFGILGTTKKVQKSAYQQIGIIKVGNGTTAILAQPAAAFHCPLFCSFHVLLRGGTFIETSEGICRINELMKVEKR